MSKVAPLQLALSCVSHQFCWLFFFTSVGAWRIFLTAIGFLFWWCRHFTINLDNVRLLQASCRMETAQSGPWKHHQTEKLWRFLYSTPSVPRLPWVPATIGWYQTNKKKSILEWVLWCPTMVSKDVQGTRNHSDENEGFESKKPISCRMSIFVCFSEGHSKSIKK